MREWPDLTGQRFGKLVVTGQAESSARGQRIWICKCDCGNECVVLGSNLKRGASASCGCRKFNDLTGKHIGMLTVLERSEKYGNRGKRKTQLWKCKCDCGAITYKATDTLTNSDVSMCKECAEKYCASKAREKAGFTEGTQVSKIKDVTGSSHNLSGVRGVYLDRKTGRYRARIKFKGKLYNLGSYSTLDEAVKARKWGEEEYFGSFLTDYEEKNKHIETGIST